MRDYRLGIIYSVQLLATLVLSLTTDLTQGKWVFLSQGEQRLTRSSMYSMHSMHSKYSKYVPRPHQDSSFSPFPRGKLGGDLE
jgi:hypothetical protein